ncbi:MAG: hypothetical protein U0228_11070 [Myxococcaceae bacterium]
MKTTLLMLGMLVSTAAFAAPGPRGDMRPGVERREGGGDRRDEERGRFQFRRGRGDRDEGCERDGRERGHHKFHGRFGRR